MSVYLNRGLEFLAQEATHTVNKFVKFTITLFDGASERLLPPKRLESVGETVLQIKKFGSACFTTPQGKILVQISQNKEGRYIFKATGGIVFREGNEQFSGIAWEVKVSKFLNQLRSASVEYGNYQKKIDLLPLSSKLLLISSLFSLIVPIRAQFSMYQPLPDFSVEPATPFSYTINLKAYYSYPNPNQNLELYLNRTDGSPVPPWISMNMGPITPIKSLFLGTGGYMATQIAVSGNYAYVLDFYNLNVIDISIPTNPILTTSFPSQSDSFCKQGNYIYQTAYISSQYKIAVLDVSTPTAPKLVNTLSTAYSSIYGCALSNNYLYVSVYTTTNARNLVIFDISNGAAPVQKAQIPYPLSGPLYIKGTHLYVRTQTVAADMLDITNPTNPVKVFNITGAGSYYNVYSVAEKDNYVYMGFNSLLEVYDISNSKPVLKNALFIGDTLYNLLIKGDYIYSKAYSGFFVFDIKDRVNPVVVASIPSIYPGDAQLSGNNIYMANGAAGLNIVNAGYRILSGTPSVQDRGLLLLNVTAKDEAGNSLQDSIAIHVGDIAVQTIPTQQVYVGSSAFLTLDPMTFEYPNANFTYSASLAGGLPLPSCINFDPASRTFLFTPHTGDQNTYPVQVTGNDGYGGVVSTTFNLVVPDRPPVLATPLGNQTAYTGQFFDYIFSSTTFTDPDQDQLSYSAHLMGSNALPGWLSFDPALRRFSGTPFGRNNYQIQVDTNDGKGGVVSAYFTITVPSSAPIVQNPIGTQLASVGIPFSFTLNSDTFYNVDGDQMNYSASLPSFLEFNNATRMFTGTPSNSDAGTHTIQVVAANPFGQTMSTSFDLTVLSQSTALPPVLYMAIPNFNIISGKPFNYTFNPQTFEDPQNDPLTYSATLEGGSPLPAGLNFDASIFTLYGEVAVPQSLRITIKAKNPSGAYALDTFTMNVIDGGSYPPIVLNPLQDAIATVGAAFSMSVPPSTFQDTNGDSLTITVSQQGGLPLPHWLKWDPVKLAFSGIPGPMDTDTYQPRVLNIDVWAADKTGSVKTSFKIIVQGESFWATFIKYGVSFGSVVISMFGAWKERSLLWNFCCKKMYRKDPEVIVAGQYYCHPTRFERNKIKEVSVLYDDKKLHALHPLPDGLELYKNELRGTPTGADTGRFTVRYIDHVGFILEEFDLFIKKGDSDPIPKDILTLMNKKSEAETPLMEIFTGN